MTPMGTNPEDPARGDQPHGSPFRILFVCTGNTCRSPMAEAIARREVERRGWSFVEVESAGVAAHPGYPASPDAVAVSAEAGIRLEPHRSRRISADLVDRADLVLVMGHSHLAELRATGLGERAHLLAEFASGEAGASLADPYGAPREVYQETFQQLEQLVSAALDRVEPVVAP